jgi:putative ABC transport system permease protein
MSIWESVLVAVEGLRTNKLRSTLTMLGIVIGIAAVIAVVAIGQGGRALLMTEIEKFGTNLFNVYVDWRSDNPATKRDFSMEDSDVVKKLVPAIRGFSPVQENMANVRSAKKGKFARIVGSNGDYARMTDIELTRGRFFSNIDTKADRKVIVLEDELAADIFGREEPLGQRVTVSNVQLTVIGIAKSKNSFLTGGFKNAYMPYGVWQQVTNQDVITGFQGQTYPGEDIKTAMNQAVKVLERKHNNKGRYMSNTMEQQLDIVNKITSVLTIIVGSIAGISLFVGGIGVMNIMLVSVTERTREIGIRKALGARRQDIMLQFLIEALVICTIGGIVGIVIGIGGAFAVAAFAKWPPLVSWTTVLVAFLFSSAVGVFFGLYPASKAAKLDPIEALRYE